MDAITAQEEFDLRAEVRALTEEVKRMRMKLSALKVLLAYEAPVCQDKLIQCLLNSEECKGAEPCE